jgi:hypothetical protein
MNYPRREWVAEYRWKPGTYKAEFERGYSQWWRCGEYGSERDARRAADVWAELHPNYETRVRQCQCRS